MALASLRGGWGRGGDPTLKQEIGEPLGGQRIKRECGQVSPAHLGPWEPAEIPGLILCPLRPPPATWVLREWEGGKGSKNKGWTSGSGTPEGWLREGRSSYTQWDPPTVRGPAVTGETLGETVGEGRGGTEGNAASAFPVHLGTGEPVGLLGLILYPWSLPLAMQSPSPAPAPPPLHSETPCNVLGLNPTHTPSLRALPPNSGTPHSRGPPLDVLHLPFCAVPKQRPCPTLECHPA